MERIGIPSARSARVSIRLRVAQVQKRRGNEPVCDCAVFVANLWMSRRITFSDGVGSDAKQQDELFGRPCSAIHHLRVLEEMSPQFFASIWSFF
jgi:hypothetical protein